MSSVEIPRFLFALREDIKEEAHFLPTKAEPEATGYDVRAAQPDRKDIMLRAGQYFRIPLGFRAFCPPGWYFQLHPRSSSFIKKSLHNLIGIVDEAYPDQVVFAGQYIPDLASLGKDITIQFGDRIGQIIPLKREIVEFTNISNEEIDLLYKQRNAIRKGGMGSTGVR